MKTRTPTNKPMPMIAVRFDAVTLEKLQAEALNLNLPVSTLIRWAIRNWLDLPDEQRVYKPYKQVK